MSLEAINTKTLNKIILKIENKINNKGKLLVLTSGLQDLIIGNWI